MIAPAPCPRRLRICGGVLLLLLASCAKKGEETVPPAEGATKAEVAAITVLVTEGPFTETIAAVGIVSPRAGSVGAVSAPIATRIAKVLVVTGQHVAAGDAMVEVDRVAMDAEVERATAVLATADAAFQRAQRLAQQGILPKRDVEVATADVAQAKASLTTAKRIADLGTLRAPLTGVVTRIAAVAGAMADPNVPLVDIADPNGSEILFTVSAADAARLHSGATVTLRSTETSQESIGTATIQEISGMVDSASFGVVVRAQSTKTDRVLRLGETIVGDLLVAQIPRAVSIPSEALVVAGEGYRVFVVDSADIGHARTVTIGGRSTAGVRIVGGLKAGERIVTTGAFGMEDGAKVIHHDAGKP